jgi:2-keto-4-pentenoate hydratase
MDMSEAIIAARQGGPGVAAVPATGAVSVAQAYAAQDATAKAMGGIAGWKGGPDAGAWGALASPIMAGSVRPSPAIYKAAGFRIVGVEPEIAFVFGTALAAGTAPEAEAILNAVASAHIAIEVCDTRIEPWRDAAKAWKLADCQANAGLVLGDAFQGWRTRDWKTQAAQITADGKVIGQGVGSLAHGSPLDVLVAVARHIARDRGGVAPGTAITTGSWCGLLEVPRGAQVVASFAGLGEAKVSFPL